MKIKHYSLFHAPIKSLSKAEDWDALRSDDLETSYFLPRTLQEYLSKVDTDSPSLTTRIIIKKAESLNLSKVFSIGSGVAQQEYELKKFSNLSVIVSDYSNSILRLKGFNIFDECLVLDLLKDPIPIDNSFLLLFPRIDTEFDNHELKNLFSICHRSGVGEICFIPAQLLNFRIILAEIKFFLISLITRKKRIFCGYSRTKKEFVNLFQDYYKLDEEFEAEKYFMFLKRIN